MTSGSAKPVIFISYSHKDEPERAPEGAVHWLTDIQTYLVPAANGTFQLWTDEDIAGGADWEKDIKAKLAVCDICILLVSRHSLASKYVIEVEIETIHERQRQGHRVQVYPIVLSPFPQTAAPASLLKLNLKPRLDKPLSGFSRHERGVEISKIADEIVAILGGRPAVAPTKAPRPAPPGYVHITGLPETDYVRLVGRDDELKRLDEAWADGKTNIISLIAEGGAGKSALVNEWLKRLQADNYRGAEAVLGWSFYSQGSKERATSAEEFLNWALDKLGITLAATSATAKGEAIAEALARRRVLLLLDGVEPLQHGLDKQQGEFKDPGLRALLRRFAAMPPGVAHGLVVLTSRLPVKDIARWKDSAAPNVDVDALSEAAGAALQRDNGVWGTDRELAAAARDFGGHPLALALLASFLTETQRGDVRRRDHVRAFLADPENPRHDHARRVLESYEKEWLGAQPVAHAIMRMVGLFDRPASAECLLALRKNPVIRGLTGPVVALDEGAWQRAVARLRDVRLLSPPDRDAPDTLDAHPLVREWFGERLREKHGATWKKAAHSRLYEHLRDRTNEGRQPSLAQLGPLYQAIMHGCSAGYHQKCLDEIFKGRIIRLGTDSPDSEITFYTINQLGAVSADLASLSWFFSSPYQRPSSSLTSHDQAWLLNETAFYLRMHGRFAEARQSAKVGLAMFEAQSNWKQAANCASNLSRVEFFSGNIAVALDISNLAISHADASDSYFWRILARTSCGEILNAAGRRSDAARLFKDAFDIVPNSRVEVPRRYAYWGHRYHAFLLTQRDWATVPLEAEIARALCEKNDWTFDKSFAELTLGRAYLRLALEKAASGHLHNSESNAPIALTHLDAAVRDLRMLDQRHHIASGLLGRTILRRSVGDWDGAASDLEEVSEFAELGPMRLYLCDMALERARLAFAKIEAFAPLNGLIDDSPPKPERPSETDRKSLHDETAAQLVTAADYIERCGYHKRDEELAELQAVLRGERTFASLPPRV